MFRSTFNYSLTESQRRALRNATIRPRGTICPTVGVHAAASDALVNALRRKGLATYDPSPVITETGRAAVLGSDYSLVCPRCGGHLHTCACGGKT